MSSKSARLSHNTIFSAGISAALLSLGFSSVQAAPQDGNFVPKPAAAAIAITYFEAAKITNADVPAGTEPEATQVDSRLKIPLGVSGNINDGLIVYQLSIQEREFRIQSTTNTTNTKQRLYSISVPISYIVKNDKHSRWVFNISPGVKSSLEYFGSDDLSANAVAQYSSNKGNHGYNAGLVYTHRFGEGKFVPLINYQYKNGKYLQATLGFPYSRLSYSPKANQHYFAKLTPEGGSWHVYNQGKKKETFDFEQKGIRLGLGAEFNAYGPLWLGAEAGVQLSQELTLDNEQGQSGTLKLEDSQYVQLTAKFRFDKK